VQSMAWAREEFGDLDWRDYIAPYLLSLNP
jgi:hypothetical protein